ncbi:MAG: CopG family ribbon-helix-helix protein [Promethearchaeota archaeon]
MQIISVSLSNQMVDSLKKLVEKRGYFSRSEAIRDAIRGLILDYDINIKSKDTVFATIIIVSEFERHDIELKLSKLRHEYNDIIIEDIHRHVKDKYCIELFLVEGKNKDVLDLLGRIRGLRGIYQIKYTILPLY